MAHATKYSIPFLNREQIDCEVQLQLDGYEGDIITLKGAENPYVVSRQSQDSNLPYGILGTEAVIEFYTGNIVSLTDFYSETFTDWRVEFYYAGSLRFTHYIQIDNSSEQITDVDHVISLNANDGLGQLQNLYLIGEDGTPLYRNWTLAELLSYIFAFVPQLYIDAYLNIFENSTEDRNDFNYLTFLPQTAINTKYYINSDDQTTLSLYEILNNILTDFRSGLFQDKGVWNIVRWGDLRIYPNGSIPGTRYVGFIGGWSEVFYPSEITVGRGLSMYPINENQQSRPFRPFQYSRETFNYNQPPYIIQQSLQIDKDATPFDTNTVDDIRYDDYDIGTYFPDWTEIGTPDTSYLEIATDESGPIDKETDRYIVSVFGNAVSGIRFNPIPVSAGDVITFSLQFRTDNDVSGDLRFYCNIVLVTPDCTYYCISTPGTDTLSPPRWFASGSPINPFFIEPDTSLDTTQWMDFTVDLFDQPDQFNREAPADGIMLIDVYGTNGASDHDDYTTYWKEINLTISSSVTNSLQAIGQYHNNSQTPEIRNNEQFEVTHDDSPRNSILGTLFTNEITSFCESIGNMYFTKTVAWHRQDVSEARSLGDLNTFIDLFNQRIVRQIVEGDFFGLTGGVSLLSIINFTFAPSKKFIFGIGSFNFMSCIWNGTLYELFDENEDDGDLDNTYLFNYIYTND